MRFGNLEYTTDSRGELVFSGWVSDQAEDHTDAFVQIKESNLDQDHGADPASYPALNSEPTNGDRSVI